jgi:N-acetylneuraminic acid mutarotase
MSPTTEALVKKLVLLATVAGLGSALAFLLVACGGATETRSGLSPAAWEALPKAPIAARQLAGLTTVWTGRKLVVIAVRPGPDGTFIGSKNVAAAYDPSTRTWSRMEPLPKMDNYCRQDAVWTGREVLFWGCAQAAFDPRSGSWRMLPKAPTGLGFVAWTGRELLSWGGGCCGDAWDGGSAYDPAANTWHTMSRSPLAPAQGPLGAWTGHKLVVVVSGYSPDGQPYSPSLARAAAYDPKTDTWTRLASPPAGTLRYGGVAAWTGRELLVVARHAALAYEPQANHWRRLARPPRALTPGEAFWTGRRLLVLGGGEAERLFAYGPKTDRWTMLPPLPVQGSQQTAAWTGSRLVVFGNAGGASFGPGD